MQKDAPAFDFYPERWLAGTASMSDSEQLAFLRLLCHSWIMDGLPDDKRVLRRLAGRGISDRVLHKFALDTEGKLRNKRLEIVRIQQRGRIAKSLDKIKKMNDARASTRGQNDASTREPCNASTRETTSTHLSASSPLTTHHRSNDITYTRPRPTLAVAVAASVGAGITEQEAKDWWEARESNAWLKGVVGGGTTPVGSNWQADMSQYTRRERARKTERTSRFGDKGQKDALGQREGEIKTDVTHLKIRRI